jgi:proteasome assembly chaperone (PAC2) family protein
MLSRRVKTENLIWCDICCVELNTQKMLDIHCQSPKHQVKVLAQQEVMQMKLEFLGKLSESSKEDTN